MSLSIGATVLTTLCLVLSLVAAQQELIFARAPSNNFQTRTPQELVFSSSNNQPTSVSAGNRGELVFARSPETTAQIFSTSTDYYPGSSQNIPPVFASSPTVDSRQSGPPVFSSSPSFPTTRSPAVNFAYSTYPTFTSSSSSGRSSLSDTNSIQSGPPVFASSSSASPSRSTGASLDSAEENLRKLSRGAEEFALEFLAQISDEHLNAPTRSYMVSPLSVWSLLVLLIEGAEGNTLRELRSTLKINDNSPKSLSSAYRQISQRLNAVTNFVEVASYQAIFTDINKPVNRDYEDIIGRDYQAVLSPVDFADVNTTFVKINQDIERATRGLLPHSVLPQDLIDVKLLMMSSLYFKGKWRHPFETSNTHLVPFHNERGDVTGNVDMMMQLGPFIYAQVKGIDSHVIELPYGDSNRMSMLVILPKRGIALNQVMNSLRKVGISTILTQLAEVERSAYDDGISEDVEVFLPKFTTQSHFSIRYILEKMGLVDVFEPAYANLSKISKDVFVSSIFQSTRIIVNEEGTEAAAVAIASLINKASPVRFYFDRPFAYLIVEKMANLLLFAGEIKSHM